MRILRGETAVDESHIDFAESDEEPVQAKPKKKTKSKKKKKSRGRGTGNVAGEKPARPMPPPQSTISKLSLSPHIAVYAFAAYCRHFAVMCFRQGNLLLSQSE